MVSSVWDFLVIFFLLFAVITVIVVALVFKAKPKIDQDENENIIDKNQETIIVKEIVKIRCRYCGFTYDQGLDSCPNCGART